MRCEGRGETNIQAMHCIRRAFCRNTMSENDSEHSANSAIFSNEREWMETERKTKGRIGREGAERSVWLSMVYATQCRRKPK